MRVLLAFPIPTDAATAAWAAPIFALMALATVGLIIWQAVRYFRSPGGDSDDVRPDGDYSDDRDETV